MKTEKTKILLASVPFEKILYTCTNVTCTHTRTDEPHTNTHTAGALSGCRNTRLF